MIEAGFPISSLDDFKAVEAIAKEVGTHVAEDGFTPAICGLARCRKGDLDRSWDAVRHARFPRVHTFLASSPIHREFKLRMSRSKVLKTAVEGVEYLRSLGCADIEFSPEDASRTEPEFLYELIEAVIAAGATTVNIPDTTGWALPAEFGRLIANIRANVPNVNDVILSTHCQNDLGLSTANSLAGAVGGARQLEGTINGMGERAGNASLEEIIMAIRLRGQDELNGLWTGSDTSFLVPASRLVADRSGMHVQAHKAIVGANAFAHESGIHQDGMLKNPQTYEIMTPESVGLVRADAAGLVLGKHSGRHALKTRLEALGVADLSDERLDEVFKRFKDLADKKKRVEDDDVLALARDEAQTQAAAALSPSGRAPLWTLLAARVTCGSGSMTTATLRLRGPDGVARLASATGVGPVDAAYRAVDALVGVPAKLVDFSMSSVTSGMDALATTRVVVAPGDEGAAAKAAVKKDYKGSDVQRTFAGTASDEDIIVSATRAYIQAVNTMIPYCKEDPERGEEQGHEHDTHTATVGV